MRRKQGCASFWCFSPYQSEIRNTDGDVGSAQQALVRPIKPDQELLNLKKIHGSEQNSRGQAGSAQSPNASASLSSSMLVGVATSATTLPLVKIEDIGLHQGCDHTDNAATMHCVATPLALSHEPTLRVLDGVFVRQVEDASCNEERIVSKPSGSLLLLPSSNLKGDASCNSQLSTLDPSSGHDYSKNMSRGSSSVSSLSSRSALTESRAGSERSADIVISEPETADDKQDNVLLSMLYNNAIVVGGDGGYDYDENRDASNNASGIDVVDEDYGNSDGLDDVAELNDAMDGVLVPIALLDPDSATASSVGNSPMDGFSTSSVAWPCTELEARSSSGLETSGSLSQQSSSQLSRGLAVSIGGKVLDLPTFSFHQADTARSNSVSSIGGRTNSWSSAQGSGQPGLFTAHSSPLHGNNSSTTNQGATFKSLSSSGAASTSAPLLGFGRQQRHANRNNFMLTMYNSQDLNSIAEEDENEAPSADALNHAAAAALAAAFKAS